MSTGKYLFILSLLLPAVLFPAGRYYKWTLPLSSLREYRFQQNRVQHTVTLQLKDTKPSEITTKIPRDPKVISGVVIREVPGYGTDVTLQLVDATLRSHVVQLDAPPRIYLEIFETGYQLDRMAGSHLPLGNVGQSSLKHQSDSLQAWVVPLISGSIEEKPIFTPIETDNEREDPTTWQQFPAYIYPLPLTLFGASPAVETDVSEKSLSDLALEAYETGFHAKSLRLYQQLLQLEESIFKKDPQSLWILAELTFKRKNYLLADSYYGMLLERFPGSTWAQYAALRKLDAQAMSDARNQQGGMRSKNLDAVVDRGTGELALQKLLRAAYWNMNRPNASLPVFSADQVKQVGFLIEKSSVPKTKRLATSLLLHTYLQPDADWNETTAALAKAYFDSDEMTEENPFYAVLQKEGQEKIQAKILTESEKNETKEIVALYESAPAAWKTTPIPVDIQWALAEAYRKESQEEKALFFYQSLPENRGNLPRAFCAKFWISTLGAQFLHTKKGEADGQKEKTKKADSAMKSLWKDMTDVDKAKVWQDIKGDLENSLVSDATFSLEAPAEIVLENWQQVLTKSKGQKPDWVRTHPPTEKTVFLLDHLATFFEKAGKKEQSAAAILLFKSLPTEKVNESKEGKKLWAARLLELAEKYREDNQFYDAGSLHVYLATHVKDWDQRAESFYKGGLLLYRAGKREMAIQALKSAQEDGNNPFYANLAKERLVQLSK